jgi:hypothetical protein
MLCHNFYSVFFCYLPLTKPDLRYLYSCSCADMEAQNPRNSEPSNAFVFFSSFSSLYLTFLQFCVPPGWSSLTALLGRTRHSSPDWHISAFDIDDIVYIPYKPDRTFEEEAPTTTIISTHYTVCASHIILYSPLHDVLHLGYGMKTNNTLHLQKLIYRRQYSWGISPFLYFYYLFIPIQWLILYQITQNILKILYINFSSRFK